jgi:hypothetical protein
LTNGCIAAAAAAADEGSNRQEEKGVSKELPRVVVCAAARMDTVQ